MVRTIVASCARSYEHSWHPVIERTINRGTRRPMVRSIVWCNYRSYDQSKHHTIWNRRLEVLNMTIDLATTHFALGITHDLCDQTYVLSTICPRFQKKNRLHGFRSFEHGHDLAATDFAQAITHDLCDQSYVLSMICHDSNIFRSQVGRNLVESGWLLP